MLNRKTKPADDNAQEPNQLATPAQRIAMSVEDAAEAAGVGRTSIFMEMRHGRLKGRKVGRRTVILVEDLNAWLASLPCSCAAKNRGEDVTARSPKSDATPRR